MGEARYNPKPALIKLSGGIMGGGILVMMFASPTAIGRVITSTGLLGLIGVGLARPARQLWAKMCWCWERATWDNVLAVLSVCGIIVFVVAFEVSETIHGLFVVTMTLWFVVAFFLNLPRVCVDAWYWLSDLLKGQGMKRRTMWAIVLLGLIVMAIITVFPPNDYNHPYRRLHSVAETKLRQRQAITAIATLAAVVAVHIVWPKPAEKEEP